MMHTLKLIKRYTNDFRTDFRTRILRIRDAIKEWGWIRSPVLPVRFPSWKRIRKFILESFFGGTFHGGPQLVQRMDLRFSREEITEAVKKMQLYFSGEMYYLPDETRKKESLLYTRRLIRSGIPFIITIFRKGDPGFLEGVLDLRFLPYFLRVWVMGVGELKWHRILEEEMDRLHFFLKIGNYSIHEFPTFRIKKRDLNKFMRKHQTDRRMILQPMKVKSKHLQEILPPPFLAAHGIESEIVFSISYKENFHISPFTELEWDIFARVRIISDEGVHYGYLPLMMGYTPHPPHPLLHSDYRIENYIENDFIVIQLNEKKRNIGFHEKYRIENSLYSNGSKIDPHRPEQFFFTGDPKRGTIQVLKRNIRLEKNSIKAIRHFKKSESFFQEKSSPDGYFPSSMEQFIQQILGIPVYSEEYGWWISRMEYRSNLLFEGRIRDYNYRISL